MNPWIPLLLVLLPEPSFLTGRTPFPFFASGLPSAGADALSLSRLLPRLRLLVDALEKIDRLFPRSESPAFPGKETSLTISTEPARFSGTGSPIPALPAKELLPDPSQLIPLLSAFFPNMPEELKDPDSLARMMKKMEPLLSLINGNDPH